MTDADTAAAIKALTARILKRDEAMRNGGEYADAGPFALDFITAMLGNGWRHLEALAKLKPADGATTADSRRSAELLAPLRAQLDELNAAKRTSADGTAA